MNEKELVYRVLIKKDDGSYIKDFDIFKDGTWEEIYIPRNREVIEFYREGHEMYLHHLEIYRERINHSHHVFHYVPTKTEDREAFIILCALRGEPQSLNPEEYRKGKAVQYFGEGSPWEENPVWIDLQNGEYIL